MAMTIEKDQNINSFGLLLTVSVFTAFLENVNTIELEGNLYSINALPCSKLLTVLIFTASKFLKRKPLESDGNQRL
jgi:hypothetical protein